MVLLVVDTQVLITNEKLYNFNEFIRNVEILINTARKNNIEMDYNNMKEELKDCYKNINIGTKYLATLLEKYGNKEVALAAYNAGPNAVKKYGGIPPYAETQNYVKNVLSKYDTYKGANQ